MPGGFLQVCCGRCRGQKTQDSDQGRPTEGVGGALGREHKMLENWVEAILLSQAMECNGVDTGCEQGGSRPDRELGFQRLCLIAFVSWMGARGVCGGPGVRIQPKFG